MAYLGLTTPPAGLIDVEPQVNYINTTDPLSTITEAGYLNNNENKAVLDNLANNSLCWVANTTNTVTYLTLTKSRDGVFTLSDNPDDGNVQLPVTANHIAVFNSTTGIIGDDAATAINGGDIQAGLSGTAGTLASFPATASKGSLKVAAVANTGDTITTISNSSMGQATVVSIPDPSGATANFALAPAALVDGNAVKASGTSGLIADAGYNLKSGTTAAYAGGGTSNAFTATGLTATSIVTAVILASTNAVSITKAIPGSDTLTVHFSADPGADTTVSWIATSESVS